MATITTFSTASLCTSKVELTIAARNLRNLDIITKSDPYCIVYLQDSWQEAFYEIGRTEVIRNCLSPEWTTHFTIDYSFEIIQQLKFDLWDDDGPQNDDFLGTLTTTLADIVSYSGRQYVRPLQSRKRSLKVHCGELVIVAQELSNCKLVANLKFQAENLPAGWFNKPDTFLVIYRSNDDGTSSSVVYKSKVSVASTTSTWAAFQLRLRTLCNGDFHRVLKLAVYKWKSNGRHKLIGSCCTTLNAMLDSLHLSERRRSTSQRTRSTTKTFALENSTRKQPYKPLPHLTLTELSISEEFTFLDYIKTGTQLHFAVAIDFTASNKSPKQPSSLHYIDTTGQTQNPYQIAICAIGEIIAQYNTVGKYPSFGFGARLQPKDPVSHMFPLNFRLDHPYCSSVEDILTHYQRCLETVSFYGPTCFAPVIQSTADIAAQFATGSHYFVLIIITDGCITDLSQTKQAIVDGSRTPLSIVIIGVGNADFSAMEDLDSDFATLSINGQTARQDIVQFVPLNRFMRHEVPAKAALARAVLAEIPDQISNYMRMSGIKPRVTCHDAGADAVVDEAFHKQAVRRMSRPNVKATR